MNLISKFGIAALTASALLLSGCTPTTELCSSEFSGRESYSQIFNGAAESSKVCIINASQLAEGGRYTFSDGLLYINGDIPANARISVDDGKLFVDGDVAEDARLSASVPEDISSYTTIIPISNGKSTIMVPQTHYNFEGFIYSQDTDPAIVVTGDIANDVTISSNHGVHLGGHSIGDDVSVRHTRSTDYSNITTGGTPSLTYQQALGL